VVSSLLLLCAAVFVLLTLSPDSSPASSGRFTGSGFMASNSSSSQSQSAIDAARDSATGMPYLIYVPPGFPGSISPSSRGSGSKPGPSSDSGSTWPLLLFLHGAGESGDAPLEKLPGELLASGANGCPLSQLALRDDDSNGRSAPLDPSDAKDVLPSDVLRTRFVVVAPQTDRGWSAQRVGKFLDSFLESSNAGKLVDRRRMYCTGVSMGGFGTWAAGTLGVFAAIAPVCGAGLVDPAKLGDTPVWAFHAANDVVVPVDVSDSMVAKLRKSRGLKVGSDTSSGGGSVASGEVRYTRYDEAPAPDGWPLYSGHAAWKLSYAGSELYDWFLAHEKKQQ
jgi:predicted peptidase